MKYINYIVRDTLELMICYVKFVVTALILVEEQLSDFHLFTSKSFFWRNVLCCCFPHTKITLVIVIVIVEAS